MSSRRPGANGRSRSRPLGAAPNVPGHLSPTRISYCTASPAPVVKCPIPRSRISCLSFSSSPSLLRSVPASRTVADPAPCPWSNHVAEHHSRPSGLSPSASVCASLPRRSFAPLAFGALPAFCGRRPRPARKTGPSAWNANPQPCRSGPGMDRREPKPPGPRRVSARSVQAEAGSEGYRSISAPGAPPYPGLSSRPTVHYSRRACPGTMRCGPLGGSACPPICASPQRNASRASSLSARVSRMPQQLRASEIPRSPQRICLRRPGGRAPHPVRPPLRGLLAAPLPLLVLAFAALAPSRPEPDPSPRSGQAPGRPVQRSRPTKPRSARPRRDRRVPPLPRTGLGRPASFRRRAKPGRGDPAQPFPRTLRLPRTALRLCPTLLESPGGISRFSGFFRWCPPCGPCPRVRPARQKPRSGLFRGRLPEPPFPSGSKGTPCPLPMAPSPGTARDRPPAPLGPAVAGHRPTLPTRCLPGARTRRTRPLWLGAPTGMADSRPGPLSLSRVGRTGQERSSRCLVRLGGVRPAVCPGNPLTPAGLPRIGPGRHRLHPAAPSRPSPCGVARPSGRLPRTEDPFRSNSHPWPSPGNRIHGNLAAEPCRAVGEPMARRGQGAACGLTRRPRWNAPASLEQRGPPPLRTQAVRGQPEELAAGRTGHPAGPLLFCHADPAWWATTARPGQPLGRSWRPVAAGRPNLPDPRIALQPRRQAPGGPLSPSSRKRGAQSVGRRSALQFRLRLAWMVSAEPAPAWNSAGPTPLAGELWIAAFQAGLDFRLSQRPTSQALAVGAAPQPPRVGPIRRREITRSSACRDPWASCKPPRPIQRRPRATTPPRGNVPPWNGSRPGSGRGPQRRGRGPLGPRPARVLPAAGLPVRSPQLR